MRGGISGDIGTRSTTRGWRSIPLLLMFIQTLFLRRINQFHIQVIRRQEEGDQVVLKSFSGLGRNDESYPCLFETEHFAMEFATAKADMVQASTLLGKAGHGRRGFGGLYQLHGHRVFLCQKHDPYLL